MPFWKKPAAPEPEDQVEEPAVVMESHRLSDALSRLEGSVACSERSCKHKTGLACQYVDRRNRICKTAWCPDHRIVMDGEVFCRRHAGIVSALPRDENPAAQLPDIENRAPSLVAWVGRDLEADIRTALLGEMPGPGGGQLVADPVFLVFSGSERIRTWERAWKLATHRGTSLRVAVQVQEDKDTEVVIKVGATVLAREVPPWIHERGAGSLPEADDVRLREEFNQRLIALIRQGLDHERQVTKDTEAERGHINRIYRGGGNG